MAKTVEQIERDTVIRWRYSCGATAQQLATKYGLTVRRIYQIVNVPPRQPTLPERVRTWRVERGWSLDTLAQTDITKSVLSHLENGVFIPSLETLIRLAAAFSVSVSELLDGVDLSMYLDDEE